MKHSGKIMIVDDLRSNILLIKSILEKNGFEVSDNNDPELAIQMIEQNQFDLILLDVVMPKINGFQVCRHIRESNINRKTPIIFITSKNDEKSIIKAFDAGAQDFVTKPFNENELLARVKTHVQLRSSRIELEKLNLHLEEIVDQRTNELNKTLKKLKHRNKDLKIARDELKNLDKVKQEFLSIISHEIRTPLNGILGFSTLLSEKYQEDSYREYLACMNKSVERLERFSIEALLITQLNSGMYKTKIIKTKIIKTKIIKTKIINLVSNVIDSLNLNIADKNLHLQNDSDDYELLTDLNLAQNVLYNILENAVNHSPDNGTISITTHKSNDCYKISIADEGEGLPENILQNTKTPFINDNFIDNNPGIGIYTSHLIMKHLDGSLHLQNNGAGAKVSIKFRIE